MRAPSILSPTSAQSKKPFLINLRVQNKDAEKDTGVVRDESATGPAGSGD